MAMGHAVACGLSLNELSQITFTPLLKSDSYYCVDPKQTAEAAGNAAQNRWHSRRRSGSFGNIVQPMLWHDMHHHQVMRLAQPVGVADDNDFAAGGEQLMAFSPLEHECQQGVG